ncbi:MAG: isoprenyl transferase [Sedimentisphaerales bacterium]|nr:isoprenyl transferase [Sedimentisphaerales bacterium]
MSTHPPEENHPVLGIPWSRLPRHIAIIMDGNGRWAQQRGLPRIEGHRRGSGVVRPIVTEAARLGLECLTLYSFSTENWKRPVEEVNALMGLYQEYLVKERPTIMEYNVRVRHLGYASELPPGVRRELDETVRIGQQNTGMTLCLALNYSGRAELVRAIRRLAEDCSSGRISPDRIDESLVSSTLDTRGLPDPDLLIRTASEKRISNFLLWQISYAELYVTDHFWPDFTPEILQGAILDYARRDRRFGGLHPKQQTHPAGRSGGET